MCSQRKIEANRLNAQHSTGPKTPEGKARVSKNALKHGFFAQDVVLQGEDPDNEFPQLLEALHEEWQPATVTLHYLVETLAAAMWRLRRAHRLVTGEWERPGYNETRLRSYPPGPEGHQKLVGRFNSTLEQMQKQETHLHRIIEKTLRQLRQLSRDRQEEVGTAVSNPQPQSNEEPAVIPIRPEPAEPSVPTPPKPPDQG